MKISKGIALSVYFVGGGMCIYNIGPEQHYNTWERKYNLSGGNNEIIIRCDPPNSDRVHIPFDNIMFYEIEVL